MKEVAFSKNDFDVKKINSVIENYCNENNVNEEDVLKVQLVCEEFLSNILFPNFAGEVTFLLDKADNKLMLI